MKKVLFVLAFSVMGFAAQAQCSKTCGGGGSAGCDKKKGEASIAPSTDKASASTDSKISTTNKNAVASKKRRSKNKAVATN